MMLRSALMSGLLLRYEKFPGFGLENERTLLGCGWAGPLEVPSPGSYAWWSLAGGEGGFCSAGVLLPVAPFP